MASQPRPGTVVAVCLSAEGGVPKHPQPEVTVGPYGVEGDYHAGPSRFSRRAGQEVPNQRQVSLVAKEVIDEVNRELGTTIPAGGFGENVLVEGLGDLGDLKAGDLLRFRSGVVLEVTGQNDPCQNLMIWHNLVPKQVYGKRGIMATVRTPGPLKPGDGVEVVRACLPDRQA